MWIAMSTEVQKRINLLNIKSKEALLIPSTDEFLNEYTPAFLNRLEHLTGFTGSNGFAIIGKSFKALFTDGRYLHDAKLSLPEFAIYEIKENFIEPIANKIEKLLVDPLVISKRFYDGLIKSAEKYDFEVIALGENPVDKIWQREGNEYSVPTLFDEELSGESVEDKLTKILPEIEADYLLLTDPISICWLLNIRGHDVPHCGIYLCYLILSKKGEINLIKSPLKAKNEFLKLIKKHSIQVDPRRTPAWFFLQGVNNIVEKTDPCQLPKAIKNSTEIAGFEQAHQIDALCMVKLIKWLEENIDSSISELDVAAKLNEYKSEFPGYFQSFEAISAFGENGAIIHYKPSLKSNKTLDRDNLFLLDCGSQFPFGTTDITRTFHFGIPDSAQKEGYTNTLKGLIALISLAFPKTTKCNELDPIARQFLWRSGYDYPHGTGHGVGHYLSVHEGPNSISKHCQIELQENMVTSIEPGIYFENKWGIRLENLAYVKKAESLGFLNFKSLTLVPFEFHLIDFDMLDDREITWLYFYHKSIYTTLKSKLNEKELNWFCKKYLPE
jgi:Xaa-Pro aminopeptidase